MSGVPRVTSHSGSVTLAIDLRNPDATGKYVALDELMSLLTLLSNICGEGTSVFFDFGVVSITRVNLSELHARLSAMADDGGGGGD